ncbi:cell division protein SepF [Bacillus sp. FDAARGOS_235]|uniref:cell division protein SepF n=1 Tax=Bacillus sp. FDAARGOS_235 TaxID=1839798 RepID=UPI0015D08EA8|nr:cell division protein SepF [Bacillus sp. FDAARGOS_235]
MPTDIHLPPKIGDSHLHIFEEGIFCRKTLKVMEEAQPFDISKTHAKHLPRRIGFADLIVIVPSDVWSSDELPRSVRQDNHFDMYIDYVTALWRYKREQNKSFDWDEAEEICKAVRES